MAVMFLFFAAKAQEETNTEKPYHFNGSIGATNNGFSFVPTFSLGKPAVQFLMDIGGDRFTVEPQFRFDLDGMRPWSIISFWRYKIIHNDQFMLRVGTQFPAMAFSYEQRVSGTITYDKIVVQRFLPFDLTFNYQITEKIGVGLFALKGKGLEKADQIRGSNFISLLGSVSNVKLVKDVFVSWYPQLFYLSIDEEDGFYTAHNFILRHAKSPVVVEAMINAEIESDLDAKPFDWNISLVYYFANDFIKKK